MDQQKIRETNNLSETAREKKCRELAVMDWACMPSSRIAEKLDNPAWLTITNYRKSKEYLETLEELREAWLEETRRFPQTQQLRKKITQAMALGLDSIIDILSGKNTPKDKISAARLAAQLDGRFLRAGEDEDGKAVKDVDSVAQELLTAIKRQDKKPERVQ